MSDDSSKSAESAKLVEALQANSELFDKLCQERHLAGAAEYGAFTFLGNDVVRMLAEELADTANYCRMQFIKLMLLSELVAAEAGQPAEDMGMGTFKGAGETGWK